MIRQLLTASILAIAPISAFADDTPQQAARDARQGFYLMLGANMGPLAAMAKGEMPYDEAAASSHAKNIETLTNYPVTMHFIEGSFSDQLEDTEALPKIADNMEDFKGKFAALGEAAAGASEAVKGGQENVGPVVGKLGGACKACHDEYRKK